MIGVGIIGCGYWGQNLIRNFIETDNCWLSAVADINSEVLNKTGKRYSSLTTHSDYKEMLASKDIAAVAVATNIKDHYPTVKAALLSGKHVLVEKPLAASLSQAEELVALAKETNKALMVDHTFLFTGAVRKVKELMQTGELGDILYYDSVRVNLGLFQRDLNVVWDLAPHDLSIMDFLIPERPISVSAIGVAHLNEEVENIAYLALKFKSNLIAHFHFNWLAPVKIRFTLIGGSEKMVVYDDTEPSEKVKLYDKKVSMLNPAESEYKPLYDYRVGDMWAPKIDLSEALKHVCKEFIDSIIEKRAPLSDGASGLRVVKILEAASASIKSNGREILLT